MASSQELFKPVLDNGRILWYILLVNVELYCFGLDIMNRNMNNAIVIIIAEKLKLP